MPDKKREIPAAEAGEYTGEMLEALDPLDHVASALCSLLWSGTKGQRRDTKKGQDLVNIATVAVMVGGGGELYFAFNELSLDDVTPRMISKAQPLTQQQDIPVQMTVESTETVEGDPPARAYEMQPMGRNVAVVMQNGDKTWEKRIYTPKFVKGSDGVLFSPKSQLLVFLDDLFLNDLSIPRPSKVHVLTPTQVAVEHAEMRLLQYSERHRIGATYIGVSKACCNQCADHLEARGVGYARWTMVNARGFMAPADIGNTQRETLRS